MTAGSCAPSPQSRRCTAAGSRHIAAATSAWTASKDRAAAPPFPRGKLTPSPSCRRPAARHRSRTEISMGARAHTSTASASTAPVKRSALGPPGRPAGDRAPPLALDQQPGVQETRPRTSHTTDGELDTGPPAQISDTHPGARRASPGRRMQKRGGADHAPAGRLVLVESGGPGESHPRAPTDPGVTVSRHRALLISPDRSGPGASGRTGRAVSRAVRSTTC